MWSGIDHPYCGMRRTEEDQGKIVPRMFLLSYLVTDGISIYYEWHDGGTTELMGLMDANIKPKPAYNATKVLSNLLIDHTFIRRISTFQDGYNTEDEFILLFQNVKTNKNLIAAWTTTSYKHITRLPSGRGCFDVYNHLGGKLNHICEDPRGLHLNISLSPK